MVNFTNRLIELSNDIIWQAEACGHISTDIVEEYNELVSLGSMSAIDYLEAKAEMRSEADGIYSLKSDGNYEEAVRRVNFWRGQHPKAEDEE